MVPGGQGSTKDLFCCSYFFLQCVPILLCGFSEPDHDGCAQDGFDDCSVVLAQHLLWQAILPQLLQKVHPVSVFWTSPMSVVFSKNFRSLKAGYLEVQSLV